MVPTLRDGDQVVVWLRSPRRRPAAGAVVLVRLPDRPLSVKRVVAQRPDGDLWLEGDNPGGSTDSRQLGWIASTNLAGRVLVRLWPSPGRIC
jgi:nickel-type superoxide dismutase maturation protease